MEPKSIKLEREGGKDDLANQEASNDSRAPSLVQGLTNQDSRNTRTKGVVSTQVSYQCRCRINASVISSCVISTQVSYQRKCRINAGVVSTQVLYQCRCRINASVISSRVISTQVSYQRRCRINAGVVSTQVSYQRKCHIITCLINAGVRISTQVSRINAGVRINASVISSVSYQRGCRIQRRCLA
ncbi:hypothetical protein Hamer_G021484 [Homarus americanus]|uniref:Uncharacterized protein n=1 Tax=Homarus americanus TaxID=6706 RepID=A0A8J5MW59_HOMAM|nr:hypothetical protein Hamer_G021484 [Homarus americanus]